MVSRAVLLALQVAIVLVWLLQEATGGGLAESSVGGDAFNGAVSAASPEAAEAGALMLRKGGNAVDAAIATSFALGVTEPAMSGLGGGTQLLIVPPPMTRAAGLRQPQSLPLSGRAPFTIDGSTISPRKTPTTATRKEIMDNGYKTAAVPGTVRALYHAFQHYSSGKLTWPELLEPAVRYARDGFKLGHFRYRVLEKEFEKLKSRPEAARIFLGPNGTLPSPSAVLKQPELAKTLAILQDEPLAMYGVSGSLVSAIATDFQKHGGWLEEADLRQFPEPAEHDALRSTYRGNPVYSLPPPCGGWIVLEILNLLEQNTRTQIANPLPVQRGSLLRMAQALRIGHLDRATHPIGDDADYGPAVKKKLSKARAKKLWDEMLAEFGNFTKEFELNDIAHRTSIPRGSNDDGSVARSGETTHFTVVDSEHMALVVTQSINAYYGMGEMTPGLGFLYNSYMTDFVYGKPGAPFAVGPGKKSFSSMSALALINNSTGDLALALGSPGSSRIISAVSQVISWWLDAELDISKAVAHARIHPQISSSDPNPPWTLYVEQVDRSDQQGLRQTWTDQYKFDVGQADQFLVQNDLNAYFGGVHAIAHRNSRGQWEGAADPRRDGEVVWT